MENETETQEDRIRDRIRYAFYLIRSRRLDALSEKILMNLEAGKGYSEDLGELVKFYNENLEDFAQFRKTREIDDIILKFKKERRSFLTRIGLKEVDVDKTARNVAEKCKELAEEIKEYAKSIRPEKLGLPEEKPKIVEILREYVKAESTMDIYKLKDIVDSLTSNDASVEYFDEIFEIYQLLEEAAENPSLMPSNLSKAKYIFRGLIPKIRNEWDISKEEIEEKPTPKLEVPDYSSILSQIKNLKEIMEEETSKHVMSVLGELAENLYEMGLEEHAAEAKGYLHMFKKRHKAIEPLKSEFKEYLREYLIELEDDIKKLMK
jgi:hypothetical protein